MSLAEFGVELKCRWEFGVVFTKFSVSLLLIELQLDVVRESTEEGRFTSTPPSSPTNSSCYGPTPEHSDAFT